MSTRRRTKRDLYLELIIWQIILAKLERLEREKEEELA